jgi:hypothetical protein
MAAEFGPRYQKAKKGEKSQILDGYLALVSGKSRKKRACQPYYDAASGSQKHIIYPTRSPANSKKSAPAPLTGSCKNQNNR